VKSASESEKKAFCTANVYAGALDEH